MSLQRSQKIAYTGAFIFIFSILLQFLIIPPILKSQVKRKVALKNGWPMRDIWSKLPFVMEQHTYIFNVTNPTEIGNGAKPIVEEIGPFVYDMYQEKTHQIDHEEDDTVSYVLKNVFYYNQNKSNGLSDEVEVYFPHIYIMSASTGILKVTPSLASFMSRAVDSILDKPESLFYKVKAKTVLFDGFAIPCGGMEEYFGKLICNLLNERWFDFTVRKKGDTYYTSMFGFVNGTYDKEKRVRIKRGNNNINDLGKIVELNNKSNIATWKNDKCDSFQGTDGTIFPPFIGKDDIFLVNYILCRKLKLIYDSEVEFSGLKLFRFTADIGTDGDHVLDDKCYCITPDTCLRKGMFEMFRCFNVPIIASNPHFYLADPYYLTRVDHLKPDKAKHMIYVDLDPLTGSPVRAHLRVQFNMELLKIDRFRFMRNYSYAMLPMVWMDQILVLPDFLVNEIKNGYMTIAMLKVVKYSMMICGLAMCAVAGYLNYKSGKVTEIDLKPTTPSGSETDGNVNSNMVGSKGVRTIISNMHPVEVSSNVD